MAGSFSNTNNLYLHIIIAGYVFSRSSNNMAVCNVTNNKECSSEHKNIGHIKYFHKRKRYIYIIYIIYI